MLFNITSFVTLPIYTLIQRPWRKGGRYTFARPVDDEDVYSPYWCMKKPFEAFSGICTLDDLAMDAVKTWPMRRSLGSRPVLQRTEETSDLRLGKSVKRLRLGPYHWLSYHDVGGRIDRISKGLRLIGARPRHSIAILADTCAEWLLTALACFRSNIPLAAIYTSLGDDSVVAAINETKATHLVTSEDHLPRLLAMLERMPSLTRIICIENSDSRLEASEEGEPVVTFSSLLRLSADIVGDDSAPTPSDVAVIMYTSGTPGTPKGVVATHRNLVAAINGLAAVRESYCTQDECYIAYLPLAHASELVAELLAFCTGTPIGYGSSRTLMDGSTGLAEGCCGDATRLRPTQMAAVPLIVERVCKNICKEVSSKGRLFMAIFEYTIEYKVSWREWGFDTPLLDLLIFSKVRRVLGSRLKVLVCGSAPLSARTRRLAQACLCCHVIEAYGTTETCAVGTVNDIDDTSMGRVGAPVPGSYIRLVDWPAGSYFVSDKPNPRGEVAVGGPCVARGYYNRKILSRSAFVYEAGGVLVLDR
ncbi:hypothetical protein MTO96_044909 [Rhipicephalus appendiculatus]